jgi:hypothetical protein
MILSLTLCFYSIKDVCIFDFVESKFIVEKFPTHKVKDVCMIASLLKANFIAEKFPIHKG